jgi:hypothetical protein
MILLSAQGMDPARIAEVTFTSPDRVRDVIGNFNAEGFDSLYPRYIGWPATDVHPAAAPGDKEDRQDQAGRAWPAVFDLEPGQAGRFPGRRGVVDDISIEGLREILRADGVSFQRRPSAGSMTPMTSGERDRDPSSATSST